MKKTNYKKRYEELKAKLDVDEKINNHTKSYIHIPFNWKAIGLFFAFLGSVGLAIFNFFILIANWKVLGLGGLTEETIKGFYQIGIVPQIIFEYCLIGFAVMCLVALIKGGFNKLKSIDEEGLIAGLILGLVFGLILGLIGGLFFGLIGGLILGWISGLILGWISGWISGLILGLIGGLVFGLILGLIGGLILGLILGLQKEFN